MAHHRFSALPSTAVALPAAEASASDASFRTASPAAVADFMPDTFPRPRLGSAASAGSTSSEENWESDEEEAEEEEAEEEGAKEESEQGTEYLEIFPQADVLQPVQLRRNLSERRSRRAGQRCSVIE
jgi:hypothetical protein